MSLLLCLLLLVPDGWATVVHGAPIYFSEVAMYDQVIEIETFDGVPEAVCLVSGFQGDPAQLRGRKLATEDIETIMGNAGAEVLAVVPDPVSGLDMRECLTPGAMISGSCIPIKIEGSKRKDDYLLLGFSTAGKPGEVELCDFVDITSVVLHGHTYTPPASFMWFEIMHDFRSLAFMAAFGLLAAFYAKLRKAEGREPVKQEDKKTAES